MLGQPFMPWQRLVADVGGELIVSPETGLMVPAYRRVVFTVPRQNGKSLQVLAWELDRVVSWPVQPQRAVYTAQTGGDAKQKLVGDDHTSHLSIMKRSPIKSLIDKVARGNDASYIQFRGGSQVAVQASSLTSGHGKTVGMGTIDEAFHDADDRREGALEPAMRTVDDAQLLVCSTMGTQAALYWNRQVKHGRLAAEDDLGTGTAYFEWSAGPEDDPFAPETIASCNPALGYTITMSTLQAAASSMDESEWRRTGLNITNNQKAVGPIAPKAWAAVQDEAAAPADPLVWGVESAIDGTYASIVAADSAGVIEQVDYRGGTGWLPERVAELVAAHGGRVVVDPRGPGRRFVRDLVTAGVVVEELTSIEVAAAALGMVDAVDQGRVRVKPHPALSAAVEAARKRWSGDQWYWDRKGPAADVSPIVAASNALFVAGTAQKRRGEPKLIVL